MMDLDLLTLHDVSIYLDAWTMHHLDGGLHDEQAAADAALSACTHACDWQECIDILGERVVGSYVADWQEEMATSPHESAGLAMLETDDGLAVITEWTDQGFWDTYVMDADRAKALIDAANAEWNMDEDMKEGGNEC